MHSQQFICVSRFLAFNSQVYMLMNIINNFYFVYSIQLGQYHLHFSALLSLEVVYLSFILCSSFMADVESIEKGKDHL
jgi:hypothetical protein